MYIVDVVGTLWEGCRATYRYESDELPANWNAVKRLARDFQGVEDYRISQRTLEVEPLPDGWRRVKTFRILKPWATGEAAEMFAASHEPCFDDEGALDATAREEEEK